MFPNPIVRKENCPSGVVNGEAGGKIIRKARDESMSALKKSPMLPT